MADKRRAFWKLLVDTEGNPSTADIVSIGFSEGFAVETVIKLSQLSRTQLRKVLDKAQEELDKE